MSAAPTAAEAERHAAYRWQIACHEAGHAVAATALGIRFSVARLWWERRGLLTTRWEVRGEVDLSSTGVAADHCALASLAGPVAEAVAVSRRSWLTGYGTALRAAQNTSTVDMRAVRTVLAEPGATFDVAAAEEAAHVLIRRRWSAVERIAAALVERDRLTAGQVRALT